MNYIQYFDIQLASNDKRNIKGIELENKIKLILISDPDINTSSCSVAVGAGYLQDDFQGTAHFLEHLLFLGNEKYPEDNIYNSKLAENNGSSNAFTAMTFTTYFFTNGYSTLLSVKNTGKVSFKKCDTCLPPCPSNTE